MRGEIDLAGAISGNTVLTADSTTWVFSANHTLQFGSGVSLSTSGTESSFINKGTLTVSGATLNINTSAFTNQGTLNAVSSGVFDFNGSFDIDSLGIITGDTSGNVKVSGSLLGDTTNASQYAPQSNLTFDGGGTLTSPQTWRVGDGAGFACRLRRILQQFCVSNRYYHEWHSRKIGQSVGQCIEYDHEQRGRLR